MNMKLASFEERLGRRDRTPTIVDSRLAARMGDIENSRDGLVLEESLAIFSLSMDEVLGKL
jgi:hypothetical protein